MSTIEVGLVEQIANQIVSMSQKEFNAECAEMYRYQHLETLSMEEAREFW